MWIPASDTHAIENVAVSCIFSDQLPLKFLKNASKYAEDLLASGDFSEKTDIQATSLKVSDGAPVVEQPAVVGHSYLSRPNVEVLRFQTELAHFNASEYGTWKGFVEEANRLLEPFVSEALTVTSVKHLKLEYTDRFVFKGPIDQADISGVLNANFGVRVPAAALDNGMPWHDRCGWFETTDDGFLLINCNIAVGDVTHRDDVDVLLKSVQIVTVVETRFEQPIESYDRLQSLLDQLHIKSKHVFGTVVSDNAAEMVSLK